MHAMYVTSIFFKLKSWRSCFFLLLNVIIIQVSPPSLTSSSLHSCPVPCPVINHRRTDDEFVNLPHYDVYQHLLIFHDDPQEHQCCYVAVRSLLLFFFFFPYLLFFITLVCLALGTSGILWCMTILCSSSWWMWAKETEESWDTVSVTTYLRDAISCCTVLLVHEWLTLLYSY
jgi:hypothetical protein